MTLTRGSFVISTAACATLMGTALSGCSSSTDAMAYNAAVTATWRGFSKSSIDMGVLYRELVRYATLAPNNHNTQPWKFHVQNGQISILPDYSRRCEAVDPDDHHLFVSLGCAVENVVLAAAAMGLNAEVIYDAAGGAVRISLERRTSRIASPLFHVIPERESTRSVYDGRPAPLQDLSTLEHASLTSGTNLMLLTEQKKVEAVLEYVIQANTAEIRNRAIVGELKRWIRFSYADALRTRDGLFTLCTGNPVAPRWLGNMLFDVAFRAKSENDKYARQIRSSAGLAIFVSEVVDKPHWVDVGRCIQRFLLQATALGMRVAFVNQPIEVRAVRSQLASYLGIGHGHPDSIVRFGYGPEMPRSLRRPVEQVIV